MLLCTSFLLIKNFPTIYYILYLVVKIHEREAAYQQAGEFWLTCKNE